MKILFILSLLGLLSFHSSTSTLIEDGITIYGKNDSLEICVQIDKINNEDIAQITIINGHSKPITLDTLFQEGIVISRKCQNNWIKYTLFDSEKTDFHEHDYSYIIKPKKRLVINRRIEESPNFTLKANYYVLDEPSINSDSSLNIYSSNQLSLSNIPLVFCD